MSGRLNQLRIRYGHARAYCCGCRPPGRYTPVIGHLIVPGVTRADVYIDWADGQWNQCASVPSAVKVHYARGYVYPAAFVLEDANTQDEARWRDWFRHSLASAANDYHRVVQVSSFQRREQNLAWARWAEHELAMLDLDEPTAIAARRLLLGGFAGSPEELVMVASAVSE